MGYEKVAQVEGSGQFSVRGGIIDIFPLTEEVPYRIELWGDEVDSIRTFDPESQRSIEQVDEAVIYPATEMALTPEQIQDGTEAIEKDRRKYVKKLRDAMKTEEAYRMDSAVSEVLEGLREDFRVHGLGSYIRYFCKETVSFLNYFPVDELTIFLDEPLRLEGKKQRRPRRSSGHVAPSRGRLSASGADFLPLFGEGDAGDGNASAHSFTAGAGSEALRHDG